MPLASRMDSSGGCQATTKLLLNCLSRWKSLGGGTGKCDGQILKFFEKILYDNIKKRATMENQKYGSE